MKILRFVAVLLCLLAVQLPGANAVISACAEDRCAADQAFCVNYAWSVCTIPPYTYPDILVNECHYDENGCYLYNQCDYMCH